MGIWKIEACIDEERIGCRWGYVIAETEAEAIAAARCFPEHSHVFAHPMRQGMLWPGAPGKTHFWPD